MRIDKRDTHKLGFMWEGRRYVFVRALFGLNTIIIVSLFQALMEAMLSGVREVVVIYLDDVIVVTLIPLAG
jgi:hypothetical protein